MSSTIILSSILYVDQVLRLYHNFICMINTRLYISLYKQVYKLQIKSSHSHVNNMKKIIFTLITFKLIISNLLINTKHFKYILSGKIIFVLFVSCYMVLCMKLPVTN